MNCRQLIILEVRNELNTTDFEDVFSCDLSYQNFIVQLDVLYRNKKQCDLSVVLEDIWYIMNTFKTEQQLNDCYFKIINYLEEV